MSMNPLGALPARFRRPRILILGCGHVGERIGQLLRSKAHVVATTTTTDKVASLRQMGLVPAVVDLDCPRSASRWSGWAQRVVHAVPPNASGSVDTRTQRAVQSLSLRGKLRAAVYISTTGVYGNRQGAWVRESQGLSPHTARAIRRADAERRWREHMPRWTVLRAPGIYSLDRSEGNPLERLRRGAPTLLPECDVYTNRIHAQDLARGCCLAIWGRAPYRAIHLADESNSKSGDYLEAIAQAVGLPVPERITLEQARERLTPMTLSFLTESRRLITDRQAKDLKLHLHYPTVFEALAKKSLR